ncbi:MAG: hypothetical protein ACPG5T_10655, partial [Endozoicomonas sp.]
QYPRGTSRELENSIGITTAPGTEGNQIRRERDDSVYRQLEQERGHLLHGSRYRVRCGLHWCY